jgi:two-component system, LytTR family, sensor histidine kinase AlgZ
VTSLGTSDSPASDWRALGIAWGVLVLALALGTLPFLGVRDLVVYRVIFALASGAAGAILTVVCRALTGRHRLSWGRVMTVAGIASFGLGLLCSAAAQAGETWYTRPVPAQIEWGQVLNGATTAWFVLVAWCAAFLAMRHRRAMEAARHQALAAEALARDAQLRALRYQVNPHFLFNTLNAISTLIVEGRPGAARTMLARLGDYFRATLDADGAQLVLVADEVALTEQYLEIEKIRLGERLVVGMDVGAAALPARIPHLLLQPLVENAVRHGIAPLRSGGRIAVRIARVDAHLLIMVANNGPPGPSGNPPRKGVGLDNTAARLRQLYGDDHTLEFRAPPAGGYEVSIRIPFQ